MFIEMASSSAFRALESRPLREDHVRELDGYEECASMFTEVHLLSIHLCQSPIRRLHHVSDYAYGCEHGNNINDFIEERDLEVGNEGNWSDIDGEEFVRHYMNLPPLPPSSKGILTLDQSGQP